MRFLRIGRVGYPEESFHWPYWINYFQRYLNYTSHGQRLNFFEGLKVER